MKFKTLDDVEREKKVRERDEMNENIATDIDDVINRVQTKISIRRPKKKKRGIIKKILWVVFFLFLLVMLINFVLLNIWALKFFIKELFGFLWR
ncbi:MAG TPA: hypothetical protein P5277_03980 [Candidatus Paceibacterota bacterium]|nr:hypothetical protein [Candidatus Paceibacterota bacterium]